MKKVVIAIVALLCVALVCGGFYYVKNHSDSSLEEGELTEIQKIITRDLEQNYPATPREVIKFYDRIILCYYDHEYTDEEFDQLTDQALMLFDDELAANNPKDEYQEQVLQEVEEYESRKRSIRTATVCDSKDVVYLTDSDTDDELAYVTVSYFVKEGTSYDRTYQEYVLRKDEDGCWKILTYYQIEGDSSEDEDND